MLGKISTRNRKIKNSRRLSSKLTGEEVDLEVYTKLAKDTIEMEHEMVFKTFYVISFFFFEEIAKLRKCITKMSSIYLTFWMIIKLATPESEHCYKGQEHEEHVRLVCHHHQRQWKNRHDNWIFIFLQKKYQHWQTGNKGGVTKEQKR